MGVADLRAAFNEGAGLGFSCDVARLGYEQHEDIQFTRLIFRGKAADGTPFEVKSDRLRPEADVNAEARRLGAVKAQKPEGSP